MSEIRINEMIRKLRCDKGISQETLAAICDVSMQAVSKWENGQSCPDITFLPLLAEYFGVSTDYLLTGKNFQNIPENMENDGLSDENTLYIIQYRNGKIIDKKLWTKEQIEDKSNAIRIRFDEAFQHLTAGLQIKIWGNANIEAPDTTMNLQAGANVNCGTVQGDIHAGANVNCLNTNGNLSAGRDINCSNICGDTSVGNSLICDSIDGDVSVGCNVNCTTISGDVSAGCSITCETIEGNAEAGADIFNGLLKAVEKEREHYAAIIPERG